MPQFSQRNAFGLRNPWLLGVLALIVLVFIVNGVFIWLSVQSRPALVDAIGDNPVRKGRDIIRRELEAHQSIGWQLTVQPPSNHVVAEPAHYRVTVKDRAGRVVTGARMTVTAYRAADAAQDFAVPFAEAAPGEYAGELIFPLKGYWELHFKLALGEMRYSVTGDRLWVNPPSSSPAH